MERAMAEPKIPTADEPLTADERKAIRLRIALATIHEGGPVVLCVPATLGEPGLEQDEWDDAIRNVGEVLVGIGALSPEGGGG